MAFVPIAGLVPQYDENPSWWLKFYVPGTSTPKVMATDATGLTQLAKAQLDLCGFVTTDGETLFIPFVEDRYDCYLFPTEAEADANDTINAIRLAENILAPDPEGNPLGFAGFVTYEEFGVDLTGVTPSDFEIKACHDYANANNLKVQQKWGTVLWRATNIIVQTDTDLSGLTVRFDASSGDALPNYSAPRMYDVTSKNESFNLSATDITALNTTYASYFYAGTTKLPTPIFDQYPRALIRITSSVVDIYRNGTDPVLTKEYTTLARGGMLDFPLYKNFGGTITEVRIIPAEDFYLEFRAPKFFFDGVASVRGIAVRRNDTVLSGVITIEPVTPPANVRQFIEVYDCANVTLENFDAQAMERTDSPNGTYLLNMAGVVNATFNKLKGNAGWGATGDSFLKNLSFNECVLNRIDAHWSVYDIFITRCTLLNWGILVTGGGKMVARDCKYIISADQEGVIGDVRQYRFIQGRSDYGAEWDGDILVDGLDIFVDYGTTLASNLRIVRLYGQNSIDFGRPEVLGRTITVKNVTVNLSPVEMSDQAGSRITAVDYDQYNNEHQIQYYPHKIVVDNVTYSNPPKKRWIVAYSAPFTFSDLAKIVDDAAITYDNEGQYTQLIQVSNINGGTEATYYGNAASPLINHQTDWGLVASTYPNYLTRLDAIIPMMQVSDCHGVGLDMATRGIALVNNSTIFKLDDFAGTGSPTYEQLQVKCDSCIMAFKDDAVGAGLNFGFPDNFTVNNSFFEPVRDEPGTITSIDMGKIRGSGNEFHPDFLFTNVNGGFLSKNTEAANHQTGTSYTLTSIFSGSDAGKNVYMNNIAANTVTIDTNVNQNFKINNVTGVFQAGVGISSIQAVAGVSLNGVDGGFVDINVQYAGATLVQVAIDVWVVTGNITEIA